MTAYATLSVEWLQNAQARINADPKFRKLGSIDVAMVVHVGTSAFLVTFGGFTCHAVANITPQQMRDADFIVTMSPEGWDKFVAGRRSGAGRTLLDLDATDAVVTAVNPRKKLDFLRYHTSLQAFFDAGAAAA
jgi:hypothetical protein